MGKKDLENEYYASTPRGLISNVIKQAEAIEKFASDITSNFKVEKASVDSLENNFKKL